MSCQRYNDRNAREVTTPSLSLCRRIDDPLGRPNPCRSRRGEALISINAPSVFNANMIKVAATAMRLGKYLSRASVNRGHKV